MGKRARYFESAHTRMRLNSNETISLFDTNCFMQLGGFGSDALKSLPKTRRCLSEATVIEVALLKGADYCKRLVASECEQVGFDDLYELNAGVCPVYYAFILSMYSPAVIGSDDFWDHLHYSSVIKGHAPDRASTKAYEKVKRLISRGTSGGPEASKPAELQRLESLGKKTLAKAKDAFRDKHPAYLNDIRSMALILCLAVNTDANITCYTADGDWVVHCLTWLNWISMQAALKTMIAPTLGEIDQNALMQGAKVSRKLDYSQFMKKRTKLFQDLCDDRWKKSGSLFKIMLWNNKPASWEEGVRLGFTRDMKNALLQPHGGFWCHWSRNRDFDNWIHFRYEWPPADPSTSEIVVRLAAKPIMIEPDVVGAAEHNEGCKYRSEDRDGRMSSWSQFIHH